MSNINNNYLNIGKNQLLLITFLFLIPLLVILFNGHLLAYSKSFLIGAIFSIILRFPLLLYCSGYLWASAISIFIANWHIGLTSEPYIVNLLGDGADDRAYEERVLNPLEANIRTNYSELLKIFLNPKFNIMEPNFYSLLSINCLFHSLGATAIFTIIRKLNYGNIAERFSYFSYLFFPLLAIDGLTLMRDGLISGVLTILISAILSDNPFSFKTIISFFTLIYLRIGSGLLFLISSFITWFLTRRKLVLTIKGALIFGFLIILGFLFAEKIIDYLLWKEMFANFFIRSTMAEFYSNNIPDANINYILSLPFGIKQFSIFLYFLFAPFGSPLELFKGDSGLFFSSLFSLWNIFSIKLCIQDFFYQLNNYKILKNREYFRFLFFFIISLFIIANYSIQLRHKSFVIPLQIILTAHSLKHHRVFDNSLIWFFTLPYFLLTFID